MNSFSDPLIVFAMREESAGAFDDLNILHTGIGKINAAHALTRRLHTQPKPNIIINLGTAGSRKHAGGSIFNPNAFIQRDMDVTALGIEMYKTPFSDDPIILDYGETIEHLPNGTCGTGDNFDTSEAAANFDVVDMEAHALALISQRERIPFLCLKYISDGADGEADQDWNAALKRAALALRTELDKILP